MLPPPGLEAMYCVSVSFKKMQVFWLQPLNALLATVPLNLVVFPTTTPPEETILFEPVPDVVVVKPVQALKTRLPTVLLPGIVNDLRLVQPLNELFPNFVELSTRETFASLVLPLKASLPKSSPLVTFELRVFKYVQPLKQVEPIDFVVEARVTLVKPVQVEKALPETPVMLVEVMSSVMPLQLVNAPFPITRNEVLVQSRTEPIATEVVPPFAPLSTVKLFNAAQLVKTLPLLEVPISSKLYGISKFLSLVQPQKAANPIFLHFGVKQALISDWETPYWTPLSNLTVAMLFVPFPPSLSYELPIESIK